MLKSIRMDPKPQPPAAASAWMMPSDVALLESVEMSLFHGFGASKSRPGMVVVVTDVVVGREVEVDVLELEEDVGDDVLEVVVDEVEDVVELELLELELEEVLEVLVAEVEVVLVVFLLRASLVLDDPLPQTQAVHASPSAHSAGLSHCSPAVASSWPSPQVDLEASKRRRLVVRALNVPISDVHDASSTFALNRTFRSVPHAAQRARRMLRPPRRRMRAWTGGQPLAIVAIPSASTTIASSGRTVSGTRGGATRKRTPGQGGGASALASAGAATSARVSSTRHRPALVEVSTAIVRRCAAWHATTWRPRSIVQCAAHERWAH